MDNVLPPHMRTNLLRVQAVGGCRTPDELKVRIAEYIDTHGAECLLKLGPLNRRFAQQAIKVGTRFMDLMAALETEGRLTSMPLPLTQGTAIASRAVSQRIAEGINAADMGIIDRYVNQLLGKHTDAAAATAANEAQTSAEAELTAYATLYPDEAAVKPNIAHETHEQMIDRLFPRVPIK